MPRHSISLQISIKKALLLMAVATAVVFALRPFHPERTMEISVVSKPKTDPVSILVSDKSILRAVIMASSENRLICRVHNYIGGKPITMHQSSNTFSWKVIPTNGLIFELPELEPNEFDFEVSVYVAEQFGWRKKWITSKRFRSNGFAESVGPTAEKILEQSDAP
ncbi:MAG: hypothetical protein J0M26_20410 [Planctomycetes bacterium]|nr:hypothetical protein [Planctomycetota bacterium]